jgi:flagella basal body P-ring formation protein FlgA
VLADGPQQELARGAAAERSRAVAAAVPVVRVGDRVVLWSTEKNIRLQLAAVAEENGAIGDHIRLRIPGAAWDNGPNSQQPVRGVVRSAADVEMEP